LDLLWSCSGRREEGEHAYSLEKCKSRADLFLFSSSFSFPSSFRALCEKSGEMVILQEMAEKAHAGRVAAGQKK